MLLNWLFLYFKNSAKGLLWFDPGISGLCLQDKFKKCAKCNICVCVYIMQKFIISATSGPKMCNISSTVFKCVSDIFSLVYMESLMVCEMFCIMQKNIINTMTQGVPVHHYKDLLL